MAFRNVDVVENRDQVIAKLSQVIKEESDKAIKARGVFHIGVSGGSLAGFLKEGLPKIQTDFSKWRVFFCDERVVPEDSPNSTFGLYQQHLVGTIDLKSEQFVKIKQGIPAQDAAHDYIRQMEQYFTKGALPRFDMLLLGMGPDGHTCSLFPEHKLLDEKNIWVASITDSPKPPPARITLTFPVINNAANCIFAACGAGKAEMVKKVLIDQQNLPATRVQPTNGTLMWILDEAAGQHVKSA